MKPFKISAVVLVAAVLSACAGKDSTPEQKADTITLAYMPIKALATLCAAGLKPCEDPNISMNVAKAIPLADAAVNEAVKNIMANPDQSNVAKWSSYAMSAIGILTKALIAYGVKTG